MCIKMIIMRACCWYFCRRQKTRHHNTTNTVSSRGAFSNKFQQLIPIALEWVDTYSHWLGVAGEMKRNSNTTISWKSGTALNNAMIVAVRAVSLSGKIEE